MNKKAFAVIIFVLLLALIGYIAYDYATSKNTQVANQTETTGDATAAGQSNNQNATELSGSGSPVQGFGTWKAYASDKKDFTLMYPDQFTVDHKVTNFGDATMFTIPKGFAAGTNLSSDSSFSVIVRDGASSCKAEDFASGEAPVGSPITMTKDDITYTGVTTAGAGAGNFYKEIIFVTNGHTPCYALRYFIHSTNIGNYDPGTVKAFDEKKVMDVFGQIFASFKPTK